MYYTVFLPAQSLWLRTYRKHQSSPEFSVEFTNDQSQAGYFMEFDLARLYEIEDSHGLRFQFIPAHAKFKQPLLDAQEAITIVRLSRVIDQLRALIEDDNRL